MDALKRNKSLLYKLLARSIKPKEIKSNVSLIYKTIDEAVKQTIAVKSYFKLISSFGPVYPHFNSTWLYGIETVPP